ncbi:MAG: hypothetical protein IPL84_00540 [Chitinophagaceae bacterium]|nr:hypothetical protein [Chitinophagaceae bacterium]
MIRKLNYTNRKKIPKENIQITLKEDGDKVYFNASLIKDDLNFPDDARVYFEPNYGPDFLRFDFGLFSKMEQPVDTDITELKKLSDKIFFRIKIVDETNEEGLILGHAKIYNIGDDNDPKGKESILPVNAVKMDTNEIWRINFNAQDGIPILEINNSIEGIREIAKSDAIFIGLVYPAAIRLIFKQIAFEIKEFEMDGDSWNSKWILFSKSVLGVSDIPRNADNDEICEEWIDNVVKAFVLETGHWKIIQN